MAKHDTSSQFEINISDDLISAYLTITESDEAVIRLFDIQKYQTLYNCIDILLE